MRVEGRRRGGGKQQVVEREDEQGEEDGKGNQGTSVEGKPVSDVRMM